MTSLSSTLEGTWVSTHFSKGPGSSSSSSSGKNSAEYISARTPQTIEEPKLTTPRIKGRPKMGCLSLMSLRSSTFSTSPSGPRTTMDCFCGPRM